MITPEQARAELARRELARRGVPLNPSGGGKPPLSAVAKGIWNIMPQNPKNELKNLPLFAGGITAAAGIPLGALLGTGGGQILRGIGNKVFNQPQQSPLQIGGELGGAALTDIIALPAIKKAYYGGKIGEAEEAAGVITRAPTKAVTPGSVGETLNDLEAQIDAGTINTPQAARDAKAVVNQIYKNPKIYEQTSDIAVQSQRVSSKVQDLLNKIVPGRLEPSQAMAKAMVVPNAIKKGYMALPWALRHGAEASFGWQILKKMMGMQ